MATTITPTVVASQFRRQGAAQADTGQCDWLAVPGWAQYATVHFFPTTFGGTTPTALLSLLVPHPIGKDPGRVTRLAEHAALTAITTSALDEVQTLSLSAGIATETFKLTFNTHESSTAVTLPTGGFANVTAAQIKTCLLTISDWISNTDDIAVVKTLNDYAITFTGLLGATDIGAITVTSKVGAADGSVAETTKGVAGASLLVNIGPGVTGIADDVTNSATAASIVNLNCVLPPILGVRLLFDRTSANEVYSYDLSVDFRR
jgi:hypothetical protein